MSRSYWIAAIAVGLALSGIALGQETEPEQITEVGEQADAPAEPDRGDHAVSPRDAILPAVSEEPRTDGTPYQPEGEQPCSDHNSDLCQQWRMAESTAALVWISGWSLIASIVAAIAAFIAAAIAWKHGRIQSRAYVTIAPHGYFSDELHEDRLKFGIELRNTGSTPAHILGGQINLMVVEGAIEDLTTDDATGKPLATAGGYSIGADQNFFLYTHFKKPKEETLQDVAHQRAYLCPFGEIRYRDVFGRKHATRFFFHSTGENFGDGHSIRKMPTHNDAT